MTQACARNLYGPQFPYVLLACAHRHQELVKRCQTLVRGLCTLEKVNRVSSLGMFVKIQNVQKMPSFGTTGLKCT